MKTTHGMGWLYCVCAFLMLSLPVLAQVSGAPTFDEIARKVRNYGDHTVTFVKVTPPRLPKASPPVLRPAPSAEERAIASRREGKSFASITMTANVYVGKRTQTELSWQDDEGTTYRALSNVDFRLLAQVTEVETAETVYLWLPIVCAMEGEPSGSFFSAQWKQLEGSGADYLFLGAKAQEKSAALALDLLDHLHAYTQLNGERLRKELVQREADEEAAELKRINTPPASPVIYYWLERGAKK